MDVSKITDLTVLKAMSWDAIEMKEQAERNIAVINQRIYEVRNTSLGLPPNTDGSESDENSEGNTENEDDESTEKSKA